VIDKQKIWEKFTTLDERGISLMTPLVVSKSKKTLYLHIAKTGGSSVSKELISQGFDDMVLTNKKLDLDSKLKYFEEVVDDWESYYKFTFVRNKYDQLVSLYYYDFNANLLNRESFDKFILERVKNSISEYGTWIDQHYLTVVDEELIFDKVGLTKSHTQDLETIFSTIGITPKGLIENKGSYDRSKPTSYYYTDIIKETVDQKFKEEIEYFKWELH